MYAYCDVNAGQSPLGEHFSLFMIPMLRTFLSFSCGSLVSDCWSASSLSNEMVVSFLHL